MKEKAFRTNKDRFNEGFQMDFSNGLTVSVQFGDINMGNGTVLAEVAVFNQKGDWFTVDSSFNLMRSDKSDLPNDVMGFMNPNQVASIISQAANL